MLSRKKYDSIKEIINSKISERDIIYENYCKVIDSKIRYIQDITKNYK